MVCNAVARVMCELLLQQKSGIQSANGFQRHVNYLRSLSYHFSRLRIDSQQYCQGFGVAMRRSPEVACRHAEYRKSSSNMSNMVSYTKSIVIRWRDCELIIARMINCCIVEYLCARKTRSMTSSKSKHGDRRNRGEL